MKKEEIEELNRRLEQLYDSRMQLEEFLRLERDRIWTAVSELQIENNVLRKELGNK